MTHACARERRVVNRVSPALESVVFRIEYGPLSSGAEVSRDTEDLPQVEGAVCVLGAP